MPDVNVVAGADLYDGHLQTAKEETGGRMKLGREYRAVLDNKEVDAVVIATPDHWHARMVLDALAAGKDVYCEKPLTWSPGEGKAIIQAADHTDRILVVGSEWKSTALAQKAKEVVKSGVLGKINLVRHNRCANGDDNAWRYAIPPDASPRTCDWPAFLGSAPRIPWNAEHFFRWRCWWEYSGGLATDLFVHSITLLQEVLGVGLPRSVVSQGGIFTWMDGRTVPDQMSSMYEYPQGFCFLMSVNMGNSYGDPNMMLTIMGSEATLVMGGKDAPLMLVEESKPAVNDRAVICWPKRMREEFLEKLGLSADNAASARPARRIQPIPFEIDQKNDARHVGNYPHTRAFVKSVKERTPSVEDARFGHRAALASHMANRAYREQRRIEFDENTV
jgi:predicted dehydrogenase